MRRAARGGASAEREKNVRREDRSGTKRFRGDFHNNRSPHLSSMHLPLSRVVIISTRLGKQANISDCFLLIRGERTVVFFFLPQWRD